MTAINSSSKNTRVKSCCKNHTQMNNESKSLFSYASVFITCMHMGRRRREEEKESSCVHNHIIHVKQSEPLQ